MRPSVNAELVREAALDLFARQGYHGTAVSEIAAVVGIRTPSLYNHMDSKQDLLAQIIGTTTRAVWADYRTAVAGQADVTGRLRAAAEVYARRHATHPREALIVNRDVSSLQEPLRGDVQALRRRHEQAIRALIESGCREGAFSVSEPLLASFGILELCVSIARWFRPDGPLSAEEVAAQYAEFAVRIATG
jgi:AcrR family transcriptional regulator